MTGKLIYTRFRLAAGLACALAVLVAMLETARALRTGNPLRNDVVLLITDGEEEGLLGAEAFVREHPLVNRGGVVLNREARGVDGPSLMFETTEDNARLVEVFGDAVAHPRGDSSMVAMYRMLPNNTDFTALAKAGFAGLDSAYIEGSSPYHTPSAARTAQAPRPLRGFRRTNGSSVPCARR
ncbi:M28 family peptidase [Saccharopolyspora pogona]|uniref:M28 family peptidase n=1 Tax=Saccharopolyspora pogona TaxID=333966 RepID=UPI001CC24226|nr:M28 family peptidase [Saccharopolyspora pogona]